jgi:SAM-dependent methyltransferase
VRTEYDRLYARKDPYGVSFHYPEIRRVRRSFRFVQGFHKNSVLDLGCGEGTLSAFFDKPSKRWIICDLSELAVRRAVNKTGATGVVMDINTVPFRGNNFDFICCLEALCFVQPENRPDVMRRLAELLVDGGILLCSGAAVEGHFCFGELPDLIAKHFDLVRSEFVTTKLPGWGWLANKLPIIGRLAYEAVMLLTRAWPKFAGRHQVILAKKRASEQGS